MQITNLSRIRIPKRIDQGASLIKVVMSRLDVFAELGKVVAFEGAFDSARKTATALKINGNHVLAVKHQFPTNQHKDKFLQSTTVFFNLLDVWEGHSRSAKLDSSQLIVLLAANRIKRRLDSVVIAVPRKVQVDESVLPLEAITSH